MIFVVCSRVVVIVVDKQRNNENNNDDEMRDAAAVIHFWNACTSKHSLTCITKVNITATKDRIAIAYLRFPNEQPPIDDVAIVIDV